MPTNDVADTPEPFVEVRWGQEDPVRAEHVLALSKKTDRLITRLGLRLGELPLLVATNTAIGFFETVFDEEYCGERWQQLGAKRELFRVLGPVYDASIDAAYKMNDHLEEARISRLIAEELTTPHPDVELYNKELLRLDPEYWGLVGCGGISYSPYLHLSQLCELVRSQNEHAVRRARGRRKALAGGRLRKEEQHALATTLRLAVSAPCDCVVPRPVQRGFRELAAER